MKFTPIKLKRITINDTHKSMNKTSRFEVIFMWHHNQHDMHQCFFGNAISYEMERNTAQFTVYSSKKKTERTFIQRTIQIQMKMFDK